MKSPDLAKLRHSLVLQGWILSQLGCKDFATMTGRLGDPALEFPGADGISRFAQTLRSHLPHGNRLSEEDLLRYDADILRHTAAINVRRAEKVRWKYFQYLALLFAEIYLDRYFASQEKLLSDLNDFLSNDFRKRGDSWRDLPPFENSDLHKLALWTATGSGKTLLMHVNFLQCREYAARAGRKWSHVLLVTPNESLSRQHLAELERSGIPARHFRKDESALFSGELVETIEITKLADKMGDKTVAVESLESGNLVLVDEGHRGSSGDVWKGMRDKLSENGFSFEYSATFGQSVGRNKELLAEYGKACLLDYSYKLFYEDGYGKDYRILNLNEEWGGEATRLYLTACLLEFYRQLEAFRANSAALRPFRIEKPLAVFVGSSVTAVRSVGKKEVSDVVTILKFLAEFVGNPAGSRSDLSRLLAGTDGLTDSSGESIFGDAFAKMAAKGVAADRLHAAMLREIFNGVGEGSALHLENLKGADGEIGMRMGNAEYFGVINVGDDAKLLKLCAAEGIDVSEREFCGDSLFDRIKASSSSVNILIGSKKFTEGWNSWRVSTMGLMNVGRSEGSEIIQLFGRGVRLKGYGMSLKRSSADVAIPAEAKPPKEISLLETLNIFGVRADYMAQFKEFLEAEGLGTNGGDYREVKLPILPVVRLSEKKLKYLRLKDGRDFVREEVVALSPNCGADGKLRLSEKEISLDYYPRVQMLKSGKGLSSPGASVRREDVLTPEMLRWIDWDRLFFDLCAFKRERQLWNLSIERKCLPEILADSGWYRLAIPDGALTPGDYAKSTGLWQEIAGRLLRLYAERFYNKRKSAWTSRNMTVCLLDESDPNFETEYALLVQKDKEEILGKLETLKARLEECKKSGNSPDELKIDERFGSFAAFSFPRHLYEPLLWQDSDDFLVKISPVPLNGGEHAFVEDLKSYFEGNPGFFTGKSLYLLRNQSRKGIGFFETNNFYPDFILWLVEGDGHQHVAFIDPKGILHLKGFGDPKISLAERIHDDIEKSVGDSSFTLDSFILSNTRHKEVSHWEGGGTVSGFNRHHVLFQTEDQKESYVGLLLRELEQRGSLGSRQPGE